MMKHPMPEIPVYAAGTGPNGDFRSGDFSVWRQITLEALVADRDYNIERAARYQAIIDLIEEEAS